METIYQIKKVKKWLIGHKIKLLLQSAHLVQTKFVRLSHFEKIGPVVQLDRISDFGSEGWGFESSLGHKKML